MRLPILILFLLFFSCRSETAYRTTTITTQVEVMLPTDAIYGNLSSFGGFHAAVPDLFIAESIEDHDNHIKRTLKLSSGDSITDILLESDDLNKTIQFKTAQTTLAIEQLTHSMEVKSLASDKSQVTWSSTGKVQNQHRDHIEDRIRGIQESYLFSIKLLGEELEELLNDPDF